MGRGNAVNKGEAVKSEWKVAALKTSERGQNSEKPGHKIRLEFRPRGYRGSSLSFH